MFYHFRVHEEEDGYWAECVELPGCKTQADLMEELVRNAEETLNLYLEEPVDSFITFPRPSAAEGGDVIEVPVDPQIALSVLLRSYRAQRP